MIYKLGKFCNHSFARMVFILTFSILPFIFVLSSAYLENSQLINQQLRLDALSIQAKKTHQKRLKKKYFLQNYTHYDPYFLNSKIESINFSQKEQKQLREILNHPIFGCNSLIKNRVKKLEQDNSLRFREEKIRSTPLIKETEEHQIGTIDIDLHDLDVLLSEIEGVIIGTHTPAKSGPQLIITNFTLNRKNHNSLRDSFELQVNLLKREFLKKINPIKNHD